VSVKVIVIAVVSIYKIVLVEALQGFERPTTQDGSSHPSAAKVIAIEVTVDLFVL
jgi:hypothetical protein